jgi:hypothetical protein
MCGILFHCTHAKSFQDPERFCDGVRIARRLISNPELSQRGASRAHLRIQVGAATSPRSPQSSSQWRHLLHLVLAREIVHMNL